MSADQVTTIILRFRDFAIPKGQTIARHQQIIEQSARHRVWWGWWRKLDETIPDDAFRNLASQAEHGLEVFLFDSGQNLLYKAVCTNLRWDAQRKEILTESPEATPEYYNQQPLLAWFEFSEITPVPDVEGTLQKFSYERVDEVFVDKTSHYSEFYGKRVHSAEELRFQDRSVWFVRPFRASDFTHEIILRNPQVPVHFSRSYIESDSNALIWLSDLHFSKEGHHAFPFKPIGNRFDLGERLERDFKGKYPKLAGVVMSGDLTWRAQAEEYQLVKDFLKRLRSWFEFGANQIAVCPGNHDLRYSEDPSDKSKPLDVIRPEFSADYSAFYRDVFSLAPNEYLSCGRRLLMGKAIPVEIACLNSSLLQQLKDAFQGHGFIGVTQMDDVAAQMNWSEDSDKPRAYRIVVMHHHLLPTTYSSDPEANYPYSVVLDAEALCRWIVKYRVDLVLHGHMHQPFCARISKPVNVSDPEGEWHDFAVLGMGSSGVEGEKGEINKNTVGFIEFQRDAVKVSVHTVHPVNQSEPAWTVTFPYRNPK